MKKIKSVRVKNAELVKTSTGLWIYSNCNYPVFSEDTIRNNPEKFEIEYEQERKYIDVRIECDPIYSFPDLDTIEDYFKIDCGIRNRLKVTKLAEGTL